MAISARSPVLHRVGGPIIAVATDAHVNPLVAVLLGLAVLGERVTGQTLVAGGLIVVAVVLILPQSPAPPRRPPEIPVADVV